MLNITCTSLHSCSLILAKEAVTKEYLEYFPSEVLEAGIKAVSKRVLQSLTERMSQYVKLIFPSRYNFLTKINTNSLLESV